MSAVRRHPITGEDVWCNQASVSHGSYYLHLPNPTIKDPRLAPSHTGHADGRELSQVEANVIVTNFISTVYLTVHFISQDCQITGY